MRLAAWCIFAVIAVAYTARDVMRRRDEENRSLRERLGPWRAAFRERYISKEFADD